MGLKPAFWLGCASVAAMATGPSLGARLLAGRVNLVPRSREAVRDLRRRRRTLSDASRLQDTDELIRRLADYLAVRRSASPRGRSNAAIWRWSPTSPPGYGRVPGRHESRAAHDRHESGRAQLFERRKAGRRDRRAAGPPRNQPADEGAVFAICEAGAAQRGRGAVHLTRPVGAKAELVPAADPTSLRSGETFTLQLLADGRPVPNAAVYAAVDVDPSAPDRRRRPRDVHHRPRGRVAGEGGSHEAAAQDVSARPGMGELLGHPRVPRRARLT